MLKGRRLTLLIIPEEGDRTFEFKLSRAMVWFWLALGAICLILVLLGVRASSQAYRLEKKVARLEREKAILEEEAGQIEELERIVLRLQRSNRQLHIILGEGMGLEASAQPAKEPASRDQYVSAVERLRWGRIRSTPSLWPVRGLVKRPFSQEFPAVVIAAPRHSLVRASATGQVAKAGFDERLGNLVVLDHGNGITSVYGYNDRLLVQAGEYVQKGQPLALSGRSGAAAGPGLYYAVKENGKFRDPLSYRLWL